MNRTIPHVIRYSSVVTLVLIMMVFNVEAQVRPPGANGPGPGPAPTRQGNPPGDNNANQPNGALRRNDNQQLDAQLRQTIETLNLTPVDIEAVNAPDISSPLPQLGKQLFFTKNLGGEKSVACVSCHHPMLGGADELSLSVGVDAVDQFDQQAHDLLGLGRFSADGLPQVPRNAPTTFNVILNDQNMFWDGRVERLADGSITTPDAGVSADGDRLADNTLPEDATIADAQARFPITSNEEMRDSFLPGVDNQTLRQALTNRLDNSDPSEQSLWPQAFVQAFPNAEPEDLVTVDRVANAIGEYERSMLFVDSPWQRYLQGDDTALTTQAKRGAQLFFSFPNDGGAGCVACHNGDNFSDGRFHLVAFPQFGPGKGNNSGNGVQADFGRENITGNNADRYHFRTPSLLNIAQSAPYGHAGAYQTLEEVVRHYNNPRGAINRLFGAEDNQTFANGNVPFCELEQIALILEKTNQSCAQLFPDAFADSRDATRQLQRARNGNVAATSPLPFNAGLNNREVTDVVAFLEALTDPCVEDRQCMAPWLLDGNDEATFPDQHLLIATDQNGQAL